MIKQELGHWIEHEPEKGSKMSGTKENNKNATYIQGAQSNNGSMSNKKFVGGNSQLQGKIFEINSRDSVHQFAETMKAKEDYVGQEYTHGGDIRYMSKNFEDFNFV